MRPTGLGHQVRGTAGPHAPSAAIARLQADETQTDIARSHYYGIGSSQAGRAGRLLCDALDACPCLPNGTFR